MDASKSGREAGGLVQVGGPFPKLQGMHVRGLMGSRYAAAHLVATNDHKPNALDDNGAAAAPGGGRDPI